MDKQNLIEEFIALNVHNHMLYYVLGVIAFVLVCRKILSKYVAKVVLKLLKKAGRKINEQAYFELLVKPLQRFLVLFIVIVSLEKLHLPDAINQYALYGKLTIGILLQTISILILIISFVKLLLRIIDYIATILEEKANTTVGQDDNQLILFFKDFFKVLLVIVGFLLILKYAFAQNIGNLLTGLSIVGAAIALATKESLENLIASFVIFFDKPFVTGDHIKVQTVSGRIERIGLRSTRIRTDEKTYVTVPNKQMVDSIVDNQSLRTKRKGTTILELSVTNTQQQLLLLKASLDNYFKQTPIITSYQVYFADIVKQTYKVQVDYFTDAIPEADFVWLKEATNFAIVNAISDLGISFYDDANKK